MNNVSTAVIGLATFATGIVIGTQIPNLSLNIPRDITFRDAPIEKKIGREYVEKYMAEVAPLPDEQKVGYAAIQLSSLEFLAQIARLKLNAKDDDVINIYYGQEPNKPNISFIIGKANNLGAFYIFENNKVTCPKQCDINKTDLFQ